MRVPPLLSDYSEGLLGKWDAFMKSYQGARPEYGIDTVKDSLWQNNQKHTW